MSFSKPQVSFSSNFASLFSVMKHNLCTFLSQTLFALFKRTPLKSKFLTLLIAQVKIRQISHVNFKTFFIIIRHNSAVNVKVKHFLLWVNKSHQSPNFETFKCSGKHLQYSSCSFQTISQFFLQILHHSSTL